MTGKQKSSEKAQAAHFQVDLPRRAFRRLARPTPLESGRQPERGELTGRMRRFGLFSGLPVRVVAELASCAEVCLYRTGDYLWKRGEAVQRALFIESGFVKATRTTSDGVSRTYGLYGPGESMGIFAICAKTKYPTDAVALNDGVRVIAVDAAAIVSFSEKYPRQSSPLRTEIARFAEAFIDKIEIVSAGTVQERLAVLMGQLIERYGVEKKGPRARLPVGLTLEQMSEIVGARLETVARVLGDWKRAGWLHIDSDGFHFARLDKVRELLRH